LTVDAWALVVAAAVIAGYAALSRRLANTPITAAIVFVAAGFLLGGEGLGWLKLSFNEHGVSVLAEATLVVVLFTDASRIDLRALRREYSVPVRLLSIGLPLTIIAGAIVGALLLPGVTFAEAAVLAIVLAPTDAALGQAVVTDARLPSRIRQALNVESGLNDGLCVPLLTIMLAIADVDSGRQTAAHATQLVVEAIGWGVFGGVVAGVVGGGLLRLAREHDLIADSWMPIVPLMAALGSFAIADALGGSGFIAAFVGGVVYRRVARADPEAILLTEQIGNVLNAATFIVFGALILGGVWTRIGAVEVVYAVLSLTVVRMVPVAISMLGTRARLPTVAFLGWFGPRGLASIVFGIVVVDAANLPHTSVLIVAITVTVAMSVLAHGISAAPLASRYAAWCSAAVNRGHAPMESVDAPTQRSRFGSVAPPQPNSPAT
jgi:NhaP-type Na+/H+ or K+/H+ antiporter